MSNHPLYLFHRARGQKLTLEPEKHSYDPYVGHFVHDPDITYRYFAKLGKEGGRTSLKLINLL